MLLVGGFNPSEKKKQIFVSWDYYSQYMAKQNMFQSTNQVMIVASMFLS